MKTAIRQDYLTKPKWTYIEAAKHAHVSINTVKIWACRKKFKKGFRAGPLKVDAISFQKFLDTGKAQG
jgi:hypothetical protein